MVEQAQVAAREPAGFVQFWASGDPAKGEYHCSECGYGVTVYRELPVCPMCGGKAWEQTAWSPLTRALGSYGRSAD
ncbi:MAG TPA: hypothetical protein VH416_07960 [Gaiellaceae bacterium]|jgi:rubrerythrin